MRPKFRDFYGNPLANYLVSNIIDEFGAVAIPIMIKNPPEGAEASHPKEWQKKIRRELGKER